MEMNAEKERTNILTATRCYSCFSKRTFLDPLEAHLITEGVKHFIISAQQHCTSGHLFITWSAALLEY